MRTISIAALTALGLAFAASSPTVAAPAHGIAIHHAAHATKVVHHVRWWHRHHHHRHCWVGRFGRLHCWW